jgi:hypothetical protein
MAHGAVNRWDELELDYADARLVASGEVATSRQRCAARTEAFELACRQIEERGSAAPLTRATLAQLGQEYVRRTQHWSRRTVSRDHPPVAAFVIGAVGLALPVVLIAAMGMGHERSSLGGHQVEHHAGWERLWPVALMSAPVALPCGWLLLRSIWAGSGAGGRARVRQVATVVGGLACMGAAVAVPVMVGRVAALADARWWPAALISLALGLVGVTLLRRWAQGAGQREMALPETLLARQCPDCAERLDGASPAIKRELVGGVDIGPRACPHCASPWPLVPPPVGVVDRGLEPGGVVPAS